MNNHDELIADMGALMSGDNDPQNDLPLFQPSEVTDPEERIKVIDVELKNWVRRRSQHWTTMLC